MTGSCPLCHELILSKGVVTVNGRDKATIAAALEFMGEVKTHWMSRHTPKQAKSGDVTPSWFECEVASHLAAVMPWCNAVDISEGDRSGFVFTLFWMRNQVTGIGFNPLSGTMEQRPVDAWTSGGGLPDPLVIQGRIEAYELMLQAGAVTPENLVKSLGKEYERWRAATNGASLPTLAGAG